MAAKPTKDPKWVTSDDPQHIIEPTSPMKTNGIVQGGIWGREHLNWMFNAISEWVDWIRSYAMDKDNNLSDVTNATTAFTNIKQNATTATTGVVEKATAAEVTSGTADKFPDAAGVKVEYLAKADNLASLTNNSLARSNLGANHATNLTTGTVPVGRLPAATTTAIGAVEKATNAETVAGTANKHPDASDIESVYLQRGDNLSTLTNKATSRSNLGANDAANLTTGTIPATRLPSATLTSVGAVEKATLTELNGGSADKYPDAAGVIYQLETYYVQKTNVVDNLTSIDTDKPLSANQGKVLNEKSQSVVVSGASLGFSGGSLDIIREGNIVTVSGNITHPSASSVNATVAIPSWAHPANSVRMLHDDGSSFGYNNTSLSTSGIISLGYRDYAGATASRNLSSVNFSYGTD